MPTYTETDIIYLAGLFDGDGSVSLHMAETDAPWRVFPYLMITNNSYDVMEWLAERFPGRVRKVKERAHTFTFRTVAIDGIMEAMLPYLIIKREDIKHAIAIRVGMAMRVRNGIRSPMTKDDKISRMTHAAKIIECHRARRMSGTRGTKTHTRLLEAIHELNADVI